MTTPPDASGKVCASTLVAAKEAGVDKIYKVGGAQAIAALAFGTESIPKVDKIVGPGNIYVALAKKAVFGHVSIDSIAAPARFWCWRTGARTKVCGGGSSVPGGARRDGLRDPDYHQQ